MKNSYDEMMSRSSEFISQRLGDVDDVDVVYCEPVMDDKRIRDAKLVSKRQLPGYVPQGNVFVKNLPAETAEKHQDGLAMKVLGSYRSKDMGHKYLLGGAWESAEDLQETLGVGEKYVLTRPISIVKKDVPTTETAVIVHELAHACNWKIGHECLKEIVSKTVKSALRESLKDYNGFKDFYLSDRTMLDEGIAYLAEYVYLRENEPEKWQRVERDLEKISKYDPNYFQSDQIVPFILLKAGKEGAVFDAIKSMKKRALAA